MKHEVVELTKKEITTKDGLVRSYYNALDKCEKATWKVAEVIYTTVNRPDFEKLFGNRTNYAKEIGLSKATLSKMEKAFERKTLLQNAYVATLEDTTNVKEYSATQISEMNSIENDSLVTFAEEMDVTPEDTCKEIRTKVNNWKNPSFVDETKEGTEEATEEATEEVTEEATEEITISIRAFMDTDFEIFSTDTCITKSQLEEIKKILGK